MLPSSTPWHNWPSSDVNGAELRGNAATSADSISHRPELRPRMYTTLNSCLAAIAMAAAATPAPADELEPKDGCLLNGKYGSNPAARDVAVSSMRMEDAATTPAAPITGVERLIRDPGHLRALIEPAQSSIRLHKAWVIAQNLRLADEEGPHFDPFHPQYNEDMDSLNDRMSLTRKCVAAGEAMNIAAARPGAQGPSGLDAQLTKLKRTYFKSCQAGVPASKAARIFQIDGQLMVVIDLQIAGTLCR